MTTVTILLRKQEPRRSNPSRRLAERELPRSIRRHSGRVCSGTDPMAEKTRRTRTRRDPFERAMEAALRPGQFIRYGKSFAFVQDLERIARSIDGLVAEAPERVVELFETFLAGCYQKTEEIDDSSGGFGELMQHLCCRWVRARQAAGSSADETVGTLLRWKNGTATAIRTSSKESSSKSFTRPDSRLWLERRRSASRLRRF